MFRFKGSYEPESKNNGKTSSANGSVLGPQNMFRSSVCIMVNISIHDMCAFGLRILP